MNEVSKEEAKELFKSVARNVGFFGEFRIALSHLERGERPYMWLFVDIQGYPEARVLLTDHRLLLFRVRLIGAPRLPLVGAYDLKTLAGPPVTSHLRRHIVLDVSFGDVASTALTLRSLSPALAAQMKSFLVLSEEGRTAVAERGALTHSRTEKNRVRTIRPAEGRRSPSPEKESVSDITLPGQPAVPVPDSLAGGVPEPTVAKSLTAVRAGIGGWLILPAIGIVVNLLVLISKLSSEASYMRTAVFSENRALRSILTIELAAIALLLSASLALAVLFFRRSRWAPNAYIATSVAGVLLNVFIFVAIQTTFGITPFGGDLAFALGIAIGVGVFGGGLCGGFPASVAHIIGYCIAAATWITYFVLSKRVKATFVR